MKKITRALVPGSFDPPTVGHYDIVARAAEIFDEVYVTAFVNGAKPGRFDDECRLEMLKAAFGGIPNVVSGVSRGLLADYCAENGIHFIVKGARNATDFDYEMSLSMINRAIGGGLETIILPARQENMFVSSTMVAEMIKYGRDFDAYLPDGVADIIRGRLCKGRRS